MLQLMCEESMADLVERLGEIHHQYVRLLMVLQGARQVFHQFNKLCLSGETTPESMLKWLQNAVLVGMRHDCTNHNMFHDFTDH